MSILFGLHDPDAARRLSAISYRPKALQELPWLVTQEQHVGNLSVFLAGSPTTPVSFEEEKESGRKALVLGSFVTGKPAQHSCAEVLLETARTNGRESVSGQNGYYLAMLYEPGGCLALGTDVLGYFPLYYWQYQDVFMFTSSPAFFRGHPLFSVQPNPYAVASLLMIAQPSGGQTVLKGVRRNKPGHLVDWSPTQGAVEREANPLRMTDTFFTTPYQQIRDRFHELFSQIAQQTASVPHLSFCLSGGQDSRFLAGYYGATRPAASITAFSLGGGRDMELDYAKRASSALGWRHRVQDVDSDGYVDYTYRQLELEQLGGTFVNPGDWAAIDELRQINSPFLSGYFGDAVMGETSLKSAFNMQTGEYGFDTAFTEINRYGFSPEDTGKLLKSVASSIVVEEVRENLRSVYHSIEGYPFQKAWLFGMGQRQRYHISPIVWRLSLGAWPVQPYLDRDILEIAAGMSLPCFLDRRIQADLLRMHFPKLARIPFDRNALQPGYLIKPLHARLDACAMTLFPKSVYLYRQLVKRLMPQMERRYYYRVYDFNGPGWMKIRHLAEQSRKIPNPVLCTERLDALLPPADKPAVLEDGIIDSARLKTLTGLVIWNGSLSAEPG